MRYDLPPDQQGRCPSVTAPPMRPAQNSRTDNRDPRRDAQPMRCPDVNRRARPMPVRPRWLIVTVAASSRAIRSHCRELVAIPRSATNTPTVSSGGKPRTLRSPPREFGLVTDKKKHPAAPANLFSFSPDTLFNGFENEWRHEAEKCDNPQSNGDGGSKKVE